MKHFSKLNCFWNSSLRNLSSICTKLEFPKLEFRVKNLGTRDSETRVPFKKRKNSLTN